MHQKHQLASCKFAATIAYSVWQNQLLYLRLHDWFVWSWWVQCIYGSCWQVWQTELASTLQGGGRPAHHTTHSIVFSTIGLGSFAHHGISYMIAMYVSLLPFIRHCWVCWACKRCLAALTTLKLTARLRGRTVLLSRWSKLLHMKERIGYKLLHW